MHSASAPHYDPRTLDSVPSSRHNSQQSSPESKQCAVTGTRGFAARMQERTPFEKERWCGKEDGERTLELAFLIWPCCDDIPSDCRPPYPAEDFLLIPVRPKRKSDCCVCRLVPAQQYFRTKEYRFIPKTRGLEGYVEAKT